MAGNYFVSDKAVVGKECRFGLNSIVEDGVHIGDGVVIGHGAVILEDTVIGDGAEVGINAVIGKPPLSSPASVTRIAAVDALRIGPGSYIGASAVIHRGCQFAENCYVGDLAAIREGCRFDREALIGRLVSMEQNTVVGSRARVMTETHLTGYCVIEEEVFIGPMVATNNDRYMSMWKDKKYEGPVFKRGAAIGAGASILAGVTVGEWAVVGMGAVVVKDVPAGRVFVGVPARDVGESRSRK